MAKIETFLKSGEIGPIILGANSRDVMEECGKPDDISRKMNPLILRYGKIQLTFLRNKVSEGPRLQEIFIFLNSDFGKGEHGDSKGSAICLEDLETWRYSSRSIFMKISRDLGCLPVGEGSSGIQFASGVTASFEDDTLNSLSLSKRENRERPPQKIVDDREPHIEQIGAMIEESKIAYGVGASRAGLLILWAALEALLRRAAANGETLMRSGVAPQILIRELYNSGFLTPRKMRLLEEGRQLRMVAAHGLAPLVPRQSLFNELSDLADNLLNDPVVLGREPFGQ